MKRIAIIFLGLLLSTCGAESPTSPQAVAGVYTLQAVTILEITFSTPGRNFSGWLYNKQNQIAVTESLYGAIVLLVFERDLETLS